MTQPRKQLISVESTPYYHCMSRCVRRAFLCGKDDYSGNDYEHRRQWAVDRLKYLSFVFTIDICAYSIMSNHYHLVLRINKQKAIRIQDRTVVKRWSMLFKTPPLVQDYLDKKQQSEAQIEWVKKIINTWRCRLMDISWFMKCLNEHLARKANDEDKCKGRFFESRFKSQALLDEGAVLTAMVYADLNPIRACMANTPEESDYTSIQQRIQRIKKQQRFSSMPLMKFSKAEQDTHQNSFGFTKEDYLELVESTGRIIRDDKRGYINHRRPPILQRLNIDSEGFIDLISTPEDLESLTALGNLQSLSRRADEQNIKFIRNTSKATKIYC